MIEQDHRNIKRRIRPMLGFKSFRFAKIILGGIELIHMIRKGQFQHQRPQNNFFKKRGLMKSPLAQAVVFWSKISRFAHKTLIPRPNFN